MTNGEKFKEVFSISQVDEGELYAFAWLPNHDAAEFCIDWWNAEYKEPNSDIRDNRVKDELNRVKDELGVTSELEKNSKELEKDFGELDCISRADAIKAMQDKAKKLTNEDTINGLCGAVAILFELPSVTPQETNTGHWIVEKGGSYLGQRNACCSNCKDFYTNDWNVMNYCPNCGADMREVEE